MKILIFNWRDIKNPLAGGSEVYVNEIGKKLVNKGHGITLLTSEFRNCKRNEEIEGIKVIRNGGKYSVYLKSRQYYQRHLKKDKFDIVVDVINTVPFFTPKFIKESKIAVLIYQLAREFWFYETKFPINLLGYYFFENKYLRNYTSYPVLTISESTKKDLRRIGFKTINIIPVGISVEVNKNINRNKDLNFVYLGRLTKSKKVFDILRTFELIFKRYRKARLFIIGDGYLKKDLIWFSKSLKCSSNISFLGHIEEERKFKILKEAKLLLISGVREGWGIVVTEANAMGVPAVGYDIHGLRDSILNGKTGLLSKPNPNDMARKVFEFLNNEKLQNKLIVNALNYSKEFLWEKSVDKFEKALLEICNE